MSRCRGLAAMLAAVALLAGCGTPPAETEPLTRSGCMVSAPAGFTDDSIGQLSFGEMAHAQAAGYLASTSSQRVSTTDGTREALGRFAVESCSLGALVGPGGAEVLADVAVQAPDTAWLAVATGAAQYPDNVVTIDFDLLEPAFITGYAAAASSTTGTVAMFVSRGFAGGEDLLRAFDAGVDQRNSDADTQVESFRQDSPAGRMVDDTADAGREYTETALEAGADVVVPFASGAASGVLEVYAEHYEDTDATGAAAGDLTDNPTGAAAAAEADPPAGDPTGAAANEESGEEFAPALVWYGTDGSQTLDGGLGQYVIASTVPNVAAGFQSTVVGWPATGFAGELETPSGEERTIGDVTVRAPGYTGTMANGGVEVVASDGLLSSVAGVGRDIGEVRERIAEGEITVPGTE